MTELMQIKDFIQQIVEGITLALEIDTQVIDCYCNRVAGTIIRPLPPVGGVVRDILKTGEHHICSSSGTDPACNHCDRKGNCEEKGFIHCPIIYNKKVVGVMGLICFKTEQAQKINDDKYRLFSFVERMCEIIQLKLKEEELYLKEAQDLKDTLIKNRILNQTINQISNGYIFVNQSGTVQNYNHSALQILGVSEENITQCDIRNIITDPAFLGLFGKKLNTVYERVYIGKKEYGIFVTFFYNDDVYIGCSINFKTIDSFGTRIEAANFANPENKITLENFLGSSSEIIAAKKMAEKSIFQPVNVLITGENGTGKGLLARAIHGSGNRAKNPFIILDCKAISSENMDEELFGSPEGADTASMNVHSLGKLELANSGTIFVNNIDRLPMLLQFKLLSCIRNQFFQKRGSNRKVFIDVRIIAASTHSLKQLAQMGFVLEDLFYCLNGIPIYLPPLRERHNDIIIYANHILKKYEKYFGKKDMKFEKKVLTCFQNYAWPGNFHELDNAIQYMLSVHIGNSQILTYGSLPSGIKEAFNQYDIPKKIHKSIEVESGASLRSIENQTIATLIQQYGNTTAGKQIIANKLGISLATLYRRLREN